ncbi:MAG: hypothetical protein AVDCRST_MAG53-3532 [uncultured Solirubrobacteraceae bacterium]|uniref:Uncharacterized protein n=1 Tax=uncultured Solirubrobacteraceae bacterium TaxID=1162706 RepID=A0A6J4TEU2_9ACTN|nr:MAG: hypothetical protein AVDCRST_MAG53-3532 [uncultured Solirubrobacteraceae bacterium]
MERRVRSLTQRAQREAARMGSTQGAGEAAAGAGAAPAPRATRGLSRGGLTKRAAQLLAGRRAR